MESETRLVWFLVLLLAYELGEISAATRCYECGTIFTPFCGDPLFLKSSMTYEPTLCQSLKKDDKFASDVIRYFISYMTDVTEEMEGTLDVEGVKPDFTNVSEDVGGKEKPKEEDKEKEEEGGKEDDKKKEKGKDRRRSATISWLDRIAPAFHISQRSKREIVENLPGNWSLRQAPEKAGPAVDKEEKAEEPSTDLADSDTDEYRCYKLVFANMRDELEEFRGCLLPGLFDVCDLLINYNEKSKERVVFCELCHSDMVDKDHPPCNEASTLDASRKQALIVAFSWLFIILPLRCTV